MLSFTLSVRKRCSKFVQPEKTQSRPRKRWKDVIVTSHGNIVNGGDILNSQQGGLLRPAEDQNIIEPVRDDDLGGFETPCVEVEVLYSQRSIGWKDKNGALHWILKVNEHGIQGPMQAGYSLWWSFPSSPSSSEIMAAYCLAERHATERVLYLCSAFEKHPMHCGANSKFSYYRAPILSEVMYVLRSKQSANISCIR